MGYRCNVVCVCVCVTLPPPGVCFRFSVDPTFDFTLLRLGMGWEGKGGVRPREEPGDLGGVRTTATCPTSLTSNTIKTIADNCK